MRIKDIGIYKTAYVVLVGGVEMMLEKEDISDKEKLDNLRIIVGSYKKAIEELELEKEK